MNSYSIDVTADGNIFIINILSGTKLDTLLLSYNSVAIIDEKLNLLLQEVCNRAKQFGIHTTVAELKKRILDAYEVQQNQFKQYEMNCLKFKKDEI